jgi:putative DNA primase/helicase
MSLLLRKQATDTLEASGIKPIDHEAILEKIEQSIIEIDFTQLANKEQIEALERALFECSDSKQVKELQRQQNAIKVLQKDYIVYSIESLLEVSNTLGFNLTSNNGQIYLYNGQYHKAIDEGKFKKFLGNVARLQGVNLTDAKYFLFNEKLLSQFHYASTLNNNKSNSKSIRINLQNGTLIIKGKERILRGFKASDFMTYVLSFKYDEKAPCKMFKAFLDSVIPEQDKQDLLCELVAMAFIKNDSYGKFNAIGVLHGNGSNGKSVFCEVITALLGTENVTSYSLSGLTNPDKYDRANIQNKLLNFSSEIGSIVNVDDFKTLTANEPIPARLPYKDPFIMENYARLITNANKLPNNTEQTKGYFRRFKIIPFEHEISEKDQDNLLAEKIIKNELGGVLNWVLCGLDRLITNKSFTECEGSNRVLHQYRTESDSVSMFIEEGPFEPNKEAYVQQKIVYDSYKAYCENNGFKTCRSVEFRNRLKSLGIKSFEKQKTFFIHLKEHFNEVIYHG